MPQFDQGSFLNQIFWFFLFFINSYFLITYFFLPIISKNLKFRKKKIINNQSKLSDIQLENLQQQIYLNNSFQKLSDHYNISLKAINKNFLSEIELTKDRLLSKLTFHKNLTNFYINLAFYPKKFN